MKNFARSSSRVRTEIFRLLVDGFSEERRWERTLPPMKPVTPVIRTLVGGIAMNRDDI